MTDPVFIPPAPVAAPVNTPAPAARPGVAAAAPVARARYCLNGLKNLLAWSTAGVVAWAAWPFLPPVATTPFYAAWLSFQDAPVSLPVPVAGVGQRQLADTWGAARSSGRRHEGIDIFARRGSPVLSTTEGIVMRKGTTALGGRNIWVLGPGGHRHYYAHLDTHGPLSVGDRVVAGTVLGTVGNTGNAAGTPPHLHYGIYAGGAQNPYPFLKFPG
jgi:murein DD-endopeptidase MepM/ murein hydrolase activator NlpD